MSTPNVDTDMTDETSDLGILLPNPDLEGALSPAKPPVGTGSSPLFAQLLALLLIAAGVVGVQEALVRTGVLSQSSWTRSAVTSLDGISVAAWMLPIFVVVALLGLLLLVVVIKPRPRKALTLKANTGVYLRTADLARVIDGLIEGTEGVTDVSTKVSRRKMRVRVMTLSGRDRNSAIETDIRSRLAPALAALSSPPTAAISIRNEDLS